MSIVCQQKTNLKYQAIFSLLKSATKFENDATLLSIYRPSFMVGPGHCPMISKYGPSLSKAVGPVDPSFLVVKKSPFNKRNIHLTGSLQTPQM